ncbi:hypothetical protein CKO28_14180 [Rhodovibrio sodomensis]|uniref:Uncharacterized protein n=1 Tax=Rhodovibrio sodomensis TaxID=1088 RepID=A0ABS1DFC4_9PROT|nr:hypothetical protein [Rhodovibrio sodomensis]MBK1669181.1 hypothetical protein [Rhodovibrio sodomensis]
MYGRTPEYLQGEIVGQNLRHGREMKQARKKAADDAADVAVVVAEALMQQGNGPNRKLQQEKAALQREIHELKGRVLRAEHKAEMEAISRKSAQRERDWLHDDLTKARIRANRADQARDKMRAEEREKAEVHVQTAAYFCEVAIRAECDASAERAARALFQSVIDGKAPADLPKRVTARDSEGNPVTETERVARMTWRKTALELSRRDLAAASDPADPIPCVTGTERAARRRMLAEKEGRRGSVTSVPVPTSDEVAKAGQTFRRGAFDRLKT